MTSPLGATTSTSALTSATAPATSVDRPDQMDKNTFLKLLVAQLKYQDPDKPADSSQLMSQSATFSQLEALQSLAKQNSQMLALQRATSAGALVGHTVTYTDTDASATTGTVTSVLLGDDTTDATAVIDGKAVPLGRVTAITQPDAGTSSPSTSSTSRSTTSTPAS
jgi:flagellar basal-body rod modification protein FlgD